MTGRLQKYSQNPDSWRTRLVYADFVISYSRADRTLVERLDKALRKRGKQTWIDWADDPDGK